jgi:molecular chaperone GrpE
LSPRHHIPSLAMNFATSSLQALRSCRSSSLAARSISRPVATHTSARWSRLGSRQYSEQATSEEKTSESDSKAEPAKECSEVEAKLKAKEEEVKDLTGRLRYLQADFLNLQRNAAREKEQTRDFAITKFAGDLLETADVLTIALKSVPRRALGGSTTEALSPPPADVTPEPPLPKDHATYLQELHTGVEMTQRLLLQTLFKYHVKPFDPTGDVFDPNQHEALYQAPIPGKEPGTVIDCQKIGYKIKDRVLRAAQVGVAQDTS